MCELPYWTQQHILTCLKLSTCSNVLLNERLRAAAFDSLSLEEGKLMYYEQKLKQT